MRRAILYFVGVIWTCLCAAALAAVNDLPRLSAGAGAMETERFTPLWRTLQAHDTQALLILRQDQVVYERYAAGFTPHTPHFTASLAKALVGGLSLMCAMDEG